MKITPENVNERFGQFVECMKTAGFDPYEAILHMAVLVKSNQEYENYFNESCKILEQVRPDIVGCADGKLFEHQENH